MGLSVSREAEHWGPRAESPSLHPLELQDTGSLLTPTLWSNTWSQTLFSSLLPHSSFGTPSISLGLSSPAGPNELLGFHPKLLIHSEDFIFLFILSSWQQNFLSKHRILHFPCRMCLFIQPPPPPQVEPWKSWWSQHGSHCQTQSLHRGKVWVQETGASTSFHRPGAGQSSSLSPHHPGVTRPAEGPYPSS